MTEITYSKLIDDLHESKLWTRFEELANEVILVADEASLPSLQSALKQAPNCLTKSLDEFENWISQEDPEDLAKKIFLAASFVDEAAVLEKVKTTLAGRDASGVDVQSLFKDVFVALNAPYAHRFSLLVRARAFYKRKSIPAKAGPFLKSKVDTTKPKADDLRCYAILSLPRSGSTMLANILMNTDRCGYPKEHLRDGVLGLAEAGTFDFESWVNAVVNLNRTPNGVFGTKIISHFFFRARDMLLATGHRFLTPHKAATKVIYLVRHDKIAQAISKHFAKEARVFNTKTRGNRKRRRETLQDLEYDYEKLNLIVTNLKKEEDRLREAVDQLGLDVLEVSYEALDDDRGPEIIRILKFLDIEMGPEFEVPPTNVRKLRDERNQLFYERFMEDRRARAGAVTADLGA